MTAVVIRNVQIPNDIFESVARHGITDGFIVYIGAFIPVLAPSAVAPPGFFWLGAYGGGVRYGFSRGMTFFLQYLTIMFSAHHWHSTIHVVLLHLAFIVVKDMT